MLEAAAIDPSKRGIVLRAIDKLDRLGTDGVRALLGEGRKDESGDFTEGAGLDNEQVSRVLAFVEAGSGDNLLDALADAVRGSRIGEEGVDDLRNISALLKDAGYADRASIDSGVVRGLDYYTGVVFEAQLTFPVKNEKGEEVIFGSVAGGGRYDDLVSRFTGQTVPATGVSIGVSRLLSALRGRGQVEMEPLVVVLSIDDPARSFAMARQLRDAGIRAETYVGTKKFGDQFKYADKRGAAIAIMEGSDERERGEVTLKDLALGAEMAKSIESRAEWVKDRPAQISVKRDALIDEVKVMLARKEV